MDNPSPRPIRVKAMLIAPNDDFSAHAVAQLKPTVENPLGYQRFIGGSLDLGETHADAMRREVREELGAEILDLTFVDVVESIYTYNGRLDHEIVFVYTGRLDPMPDAQDATLVEPDGDVWPLVWRPVRDDAGEIPLYPEAAAPLVRQVAARRASSSGR